MPILRILRKIQVGNRACDKLAKQFLVDDAVGVDDKAGCATFRLEDIIKDILGRQAFLKFFLVVLQVYR